MRLNIAKFQDGGAVPEEAAAQAPAPVAEPAPAEAQQPSPEEQIHQMAMQIAQQIGDPQVIMLLAQDLMQIAQSAAQPEQPTYQKRGGRLYLIH